MPETDVSLTIYNQGMALVQDRRTFDLTQGETTVNFTDVAAHIVPESVVLKSLTNPDAMSVLEQNYIYDLVDINRLFERYLDQQIELVTDDGTVYAGELLSGGSSLIILRNAEGKVIVIKNSHIRDVRFPSLPGELITRPTLQWLLWSAESGEQRVELTYLAHGLNWSADYNLLLEADNTTLNLSGWITLNNTSGTSYREAQLKLIAGDVHRLPERRQAKDTNVSVRALSASAMPKPAVEQRVFSEYHLYEVGRRVTVGNSETKQVEFVTGSRIAANVFYVYGGSPGYMGMASTRYQERDYGFPTNNDVQTHLEFSTGKENGLGSDLPAGRIRVYQQDVDGAALLIGENSIDHTPEGEPIKLYLGNAFDLIGEGTQTDYKLLSEYLLEESYEIRLRNRKKVATVEIRVQERMFRWSNWEILSATHEYKKLDSHSIEFRVPVEPGGETIIRYTVRYNWHK